MQDKQLERQFFSDRAREGSYDVFTDASNRALIDRCLALGAMPSGSRVCDLGCGSGVFTRLLREAGLVCIGLDLCAPLLATAKREQAEVPYVSGDAELLPFANESLDGVLLSGLIHHLPDPSGMAVEIFRVLKPGAPFVAFDPNRRNPFMWLYRDRTSPFYSSKGVTPNERPVIAEQVARVFQKAGFTVSLDYMSLSYRYVESSRMRSILGMYNALEALLFRPRPLKSLRAFVLTAGVKPRVSD